MSSIVKRAIGYLRVSTEKQADEDKVSLSEQRRDIIAYCKAKGYSIVDWYVDAGYSGASKNRPDFKRMLRDAITDTYDVIVVWKSDRLARGTYPSTALIQAIEGTDIALEAVKDVIDIDTFELYAWVGKRELKAIQERVRMGHKGRARQGYISGHAKYGYALEGEKGKKRPVIFEPEAEVVRRVFAEYVAGTGCYTIAKQLRSERVPTRRGGTWVNSTVWAIVTDPAYIGKGYYGRTQVFKRDNGEKDVKHLKKLPEDQWIEVPYPPLIDEEMFEKARLYMKHPTRQVPSEKYDAKYMLKGLIWCGHCGRRYSTSTTKGIRTWRRRDGTEMRARRKTPGRMYVSTREHGSRCPRPRIGAITFEASVWKTVTAFLERPWQIEQIIEARKKQVSESGTIPEIRRLQKQLDDAREQEARAMDLYLDGSYDQEYLDLKIKQFRDGRDYYQSELKRLEKEYSNAEKIIGMLSNFLASSKHIKGRLGAMNEDERIETTRLVVDKITVTDAGIDVVMDLESGGVLSYGKDARR